VGFERGDVSALHEKVGDAGDVLVRDGLGEAGVEGGEAFGSEAERGGISDRGGGSAGRVGRFGGYGCRFGRSGGLVVAAGSEDGKGYGSQQQP